MTYLAGGAPRQIYLPLVLRNYTPSARPTATPSATPTVTATPTGTPTATSTAAAFRITSSAFAEGGSIPGQYAYDKYGCPGQNLSPPLAWTTPPGGTQSFALMMDDPDAGTPAFVHWVLFNISAAANGLPENVGIPAGARRGMNDWGELGYGGPCPPPGPAHRYYFRLYALDTTLALAEGATKPQVEAAMAGHVLAQSQLMGRFGWAAPLSSTAQTPLPTGAGDGAIPVRAAGRGNPWVNLADGTVLPTIYSGPTALVDALGAGQAQPLSLAAGDFDRDGVPDLVAGYLLPPGRGDRGGAGLLTLHRGNVDAIYPNSPQAQQRKAEGTFTDVPFLSPARVFALPVVPDFLGAGDFNADGNQDLVTTARGGELLHWLPGDGKGGFGAAQVVKLSGKVTTLVVGEINRPDGLDDVVVGVNSDKGPQVLVFEWPEGALRGEPEVFVAPAALHELARQGHFGLAGMQERAELIGGALAVTSAPGQGTTVRVEYKANGERANGEWHLSADSLIR
jgi:Raf kinase inhibitor-like YbhB/YbcL family protein